MPSVYVFDWKSQFTIPNVNSMFGAIALEFELKFACFLEIFILNKAVSKLQATQNFWWYSKRRVTFQTQDKQS